MRSGVTNGGTPSAPLYQLVAEHYPRFIELLSAQGRSLPDYVRREFDDFLKCGILEHGFLRVRRQDCRTERLVAFSCKLRGFCLNCGARRIVECTAWILILSSQRASAPTPPAATLVPQPGSASRIPR